MKNIFYFILLAIASITKPETCSATTKFYLLPADTDQMMICKSIEIKNNNIICTDNKFTTTYTIDNVQKIEFTYKNEKYNINNFNEHNIEIIKKANSSLQDNTELNNNNDNFFIELKKLFIGKQNKTSSKNNYQCRGKIYCSEMTSCEEAKFYLRNCPGTKLDGNNDGVPCEKQWCN